MLTTLGALCSALSSLMKQEPHRCGEERSEELRGVLHLQQEETNLRNLT